MLAAEFQADHGRPPTAVEAIGLAQRATLETRAAKHEPRSYAEQRTAWWRQATAVMGGERDVRRMVNAALRGVERHTSPVLTDQWIASTAAEVVDRVESERATWQVWHVRAETERQLRGLGVSRADHDAAAGRVVAHALTAGSIRLGVDDPVEDPAGLRRADGTSVYVVAGSAAYTSRTILTAEHTLLAAAARRDGRALSRVQVGVALAESAANRFELNPAQAQMVTELATSGARVQVAIAPAGSGKTTAMRTLARAWTDSGGTILGLAPSARAAAELRREIQTRTDTLAKLTFSLDYPRFMPRWVRDIGPDTLVIIDEAGMAGTADLAHAVDYVLGRGGSVRLVGDDQQLASISAGGVLRDIAEQVGVVTLSELHRFADPAEGAATLALRLGDPAALGFYLDHSRVHVGDETTVTDHAYRAWAADRADDRDSVMLAPTRDLVAVLNARARTDRLAVTDAKPGREVTLADGNQASAGDIIITRCNERGLPISGSDWVKNGDRWTIRAVHRSGALKVTHHGTGATITLPANYARRDTDLGYASTVHGAQGITADTCHTVATGGEARQLFYVAMTRGRAANHVYLVTAGDGDPHNIIRPETLFPPTATDILAAVLRRDEAQQSATSAAHALADPAVLLRDAAVRYHDAVGFAAEQLLGADRLTALDTAAETLLPGLTDGPAYPTLRAHLALLCVDGTDPVGRLRTAVAARELTTATDPAAVLDWRIDPDNGSSRGGPLPWLPTVPAAVRTHPQWGSYLADRSARVDVLARALRADVATWTPSTAPTWAVPLLTRANPGLLEDLAVWRAVNDVPADDRRPTGPPQLTAAAEQYQTGLDHRAREVLTDPALADAHWASTVTRIDPRITDDPYWPQLADRLDAADRSGLDIRALLTAAAASAHLPDEQPAAALWWRLSRHLAPAATAATHGSGASTLRPEWTPILRDKLGPVRADRVLADRAWPALVAAVTTATRVGWTPEQVLTAAISGTLTEPADGGVTDNELATALVWRIAALTDPEPLAVDAPFDPYDADLIPPDDLDVLGQPDQPGTTLPVPAEAMWVDPDVLLPPYTDADAPLDDATPVDDDTLASAPIAEHHDPAGDLATAAAAAAVIRATPPLDDDAQWAALDEEHHWATAAVAKQRLVDLNQQAAAIYTARYPGSWAANHLHERLGDDLAHDDRFIIGYAPAGWTTLTDHLRRRGATDAELLAAGLARTASTGRLIDQFRDRLVFAIHGQDDAIHGFIGRRNPTHDADDGGRAGPKYLNTRQTDLFDKGAQLFGQHEGRAELAAGATPVLVEGPVDALAVTLAGHGRHVGVSPLGTAFTDTQADQLKPHIGARRSGVLVATDADTAGWKAAQRAYWQLTARGDNPRHLAMTDGHDPASILQHHGAAALRTALDAATPLADQLIQRRVEAHPRGHAEDRLAAIHSAAEIIGALPPDQWQRHIDTLHRHVDAVPAAAYLAVTDAGSAWTHDPHGQARRRITAIPDQPPPAAASAKALPAPVADVSTNAAARWEHLAATISPTLTADPAWAELAASLQTAHDLGHDLSADLLTLANDHDLNPARPARDLHDRLIHAARGQDNAPTTAPPAAARHHPPDAHTANTSAPTTTHSPAQQRPDPHRRWAELASHIDPRLVTDDGWIALAHTISRAETAGVDIPTTLPHLATNPPLPARHAARELLYRLVAAANLDPEPAPTENPTPEPRTPQPPPPQPSAVTPGPPPPTLGR